MASDFKFGAKLKLFGEHEIVIEPNPDHPNIVEYHDNTGIAVTKEFVSDKLNITNQTIKNMIPEQTRITDFVLNRKSKSVELGVVIEPGEDFVLNKYKDIFAIDEVALFYTYNPNAGDNVDTGSIEEDPIVDEGMMEEEDPIVDEGMMEEEDPEE